MVEMQDNSFSIFLMWGVKTIIMKLGGLERYRYYAPFFLGMIMGYIAGVFWVFLSMFSGFPERGTRFIAIPDRSRIRQMTRMARMKADMEEGWHEDYRCQDLYCRAGWQKFFVLQGFKICSFQISITVCAWIRSQSIFRPSPGVCGTYM